MYPGQFEWGVNNGYRKFKWSSTHARSDKVRYADPYTTSLGDYDGRNWGGEFLGDKNSYMIVAPQYIRRGSARPPDEQSPSKKNVPFLREAGYSFLILWKKKCYTRGEYDIV